MKSNIKELFQIELSEQTPRESQQEEVFIRTEVKWEDYEKLLEHFNNSNYRVAYLDGVLKVVSLSRQHEITKEIIGGLIEAYLQEAKIRYLPTGSATIRKQEKRGGKEPDKSYCIRENTTIPDIAIEIVVTSGGIDDLEIYKRLEVKEVWFWQENQLKVYFLNSYKEYEEVRQSKVLPNLDLNLFTQHILQSDPFDSLLTFGEKIRKNLNLE